MPNDGDPKDERAPRWKFAIVVWIAIFPAILGLNYLMKPIWEEWEMWQKILFNSVVEVPYAVFFVIPFLQEVFKSWLVNDKYC